MIIKFIDIQFEENAHGGSSAIGTFVSNESKGGKMMGIGGNNFVSSIGRESRKEIALFLKGCYTRFEV